MFDKRRCIENIYSLAKAKGLKIGDIEEKAGVSKGYLSRINKDDNKSIPGIDLLASVADQLGVGIDYLVNFPLGTLTPNEEFVFQFVDRLSQQTTAGKVDWISESASLLNAENGIAVDNPLVSVSQEYSAEFDIQYDTHVYNSGLYSGGVMADNNCYHCTLPDGISAVYMNAVKYFTPQEGKNTPSEWTNHIIELYVVKYKVRPICSTFFLRDELKKAVENLYTAVLSSPSHIGLDEDTKDIMKSYLDSFEDPDELPF